MYKATALYQHETKISLISRKESRPKAQAKQADALGRTLLQRISWMWLPAHNSYSRALKNHLALLLSPGRDWKVKANSWCSDLHKSFKPCVLLLPSLLSQLEQQVFFPRICLIAPHPSLSHFFSSSCSSGRSNLRSAKTWTSFLGHPIRFCQHCWTLLCYLWESISGELWVTPV